MVNAKLLFLSCLFKLSIAYTHEKPIHSKLTPDRCTRHDKRLNDCNWCWCEQTVFKCKARVCNEIDMFGHFKDAIQDLNIGMEGHGVWRSKSTICEPGIQYEKKDIICICTESGNWPNPVCRDTFMFLYEVDVTVAALEQAKKTFELSRTACQPTKLYLIGCNTCYCPEAGRFNPDLCTKTECDKNDPVLRLDTNNDDETKTTGLEIYAECSIDTRYNLGCKKCVCLRNNRLVCDECHESPNNKNIDNATRNNDKNTAPSSVKNTTRSLESDETSLCYKRKVNEVFNLDCNMCSCDEKGSVYCTTKKCLKNEEKYAIEVTKTIENNLRTSSRPVDDTDCEPGTSYAKDCNKCYCNLLENGNKTVGCTLKHCVKSDNVLDKLKSDCVEGTVYQSHCLKCRCDLIDGEKRETCLTDSECPDIQFVNVRSDKLESMNGYCEPQHIYRLDCNYCRCLSDGATVVCSSNVCKNLLPVTVDIIPVKQGSGQPCPKDHMYKIGCNVCFCLANGNVLCTTKNCNA